MDALADFLNARGDNRSAILGMTKLQVHAATDVAQFEHRSSPGRARNRNQHWFRAVFRMPRNQRLAFAQEYRGVAMVLGLDLEYRGRRQVPKTDPALDF